MSLNTDELRHYSRHLLLPEVGKEGQEIQRFPTPAGCQLHAKEGQKLRKGQVLFEWDPYNVSIMAEAAGTVHLEGMVEGVTMRVDVNPDTGLEEVVVTEHKQDLHPQITVLDPKSKEVIGYATVPAQTHVVVKDGDKVKAGDLLTDGASELFLASINGGRILRVSPLLMEGRNSHSPTIVSRRVIYISDHDVMQGVNELFLTIPMGSPRPSGLILH